MENYEKYSNTEILLKRMINGDYIDKNEIDPLSYKLFKDTKVCTFLAMAVSGVVIKSKRNI